MSLPLSLVLAAALVAPAPGQTPAPRPEQSPRPQVGGRSQTDQTVPVQQGARLDLSPCNGQVTVKVWAQSSVRVQASHASRTQVRITPRDKVIVVDTQTGGGQANFVDYDITVPAWLALHLEGEACDVTVEGTNGPIVVRTVEGDITLNGIGGDVDARSVDGKITLVGGKGKIKLSSVDQAIQLSKTIGEIVLDSIDGDLILADVQPTALELSTVDGDIRYSGGFDAAGHYLFTTHDGDVILNIPEATNATFGVRSFSGSKIDSTLPVKGAPATGRGRRTVYTLGTGAAQVDVEQFEGDLILRKPGEAAKKAKDKIKDKDGV